MARCRAARPAPARQRPRPESPTNRHSTRSQSTAGSLSHTHTDSLNIPVSAHLTYLTAQVEPSASGHCTSRWKLGKAVGDSDRGAATAAAPGQAACARGSARGGEGRRQRRPASMNGRLGAGKQYQSTARPSAGRPAGRTSASFRPSKSSETGRNLSLYLNCNLHW